METKVVHKCTVYTSAGVKLFHESGDTRAIVAGLAARRARKEYSAVPGLEWRFEKVYPVPALFQPPNMDDRLEEFANGVAAIANASNQV